MERYIEKNRNKSFSGQDIYLLCDKKVKVLKYPELRNFKTLEDAWGPHKAMIILYLTKEHYGHWCAVFRADKNTLEFFDPYGSFPDSEIDMIRATRPDAPLQLPWLTRLMARSHYNILYNKQKLQQFKKDVNTCGRWCGMRVVMRDTPLQEFIDMFISKSNKKSPDWLVTCMTLFV